MSLHGLGFLDAGAAVDLRLEDRFGRLLAAERRSLEVLSQGEPATGLIRQEPAAALLDRPGPLAAAAGRSGFLLRESPLGRGGDGRRER